MLSNHFLISINVSLQTHSVSAKVIAYRNYKSIDDDAFLANLSVSSIVLELSNDIDIQVDIYDRTL